jgi:phosphoribosylformylglycinamidine (FGAM) synthase-like amidotransferase family enzyme
MRNSIFYFATSLVLLSACSLFQTLHSTTYIKAENAFILGNNEHGKFSADVTNTSNQEITVWQCPISGGQHSPMVLKSKERTKLVVEKNTALRIENASSEEVAVKLKVKGATGLSMGYKYE